MTNMRGRDYTLRPCGDRVYDVLDLEAKVIGNVQPLGDNSGDWLAAAFAPDPERPVRQAIARSRADAIDFVLTERRS